MKSERHISVRENADLLDKFYFASKYYGRSGSSQVHIMIREFVENFEKEHGKITDEDLRSIGRGK